MRKITLLFIALTTTLTINAQLLINGQYRPRTEFMHGFKTPANQGEMFKIATTQRARLGVFYDQEKYKFGLQFQDVRLWGSQPQLVVADGNTTTVHQAWGEIILNTNWSLKLGRQELVYDDSRIFGNVDWAQQARSHDLALLKYEKKDGYKLHFGAAVNQVQTHAYNTNGNYKSMQFLWYNRKISDAYTLSVLFINNGLEDQVLNNPNVIPTTTFSQTLGQRSVYKTGNFTLGLNLYYQFGNAVDTYVDNADGKDYHKSISAYNVRLDIGYKINDNLKATLGFEMLSGDSETDTTVDYGKVSHAFAPLFGTNHKFNGWMDYFYVGNHFKTVGLNDYYILLDYKKNKILWGAHFHYFTANAEVLDQDELNSSGDYTAMSSSFGMELDCYVGYKHSKDVMIKAGVSGMFDTETLRAIKGTGDTGASNYWAWVMVGITPTFLSK